MMWPRRPGPLKPTKHSVGTIRSNEGDRQSSSSVPRNEIEARYLNRAVMAEKERDDLLAELSVLLAAGVGVKIERLTRERDVLIVAARETAEIAWDQGHDEACHGTPVEQNPYRDGRVS